MRRTAFVLALQHSSGTKFVSFPQVQRFLDKIVTSHQFVDLLLQPFNSAATIVGPWSICYVSVFSLSRSSRGSSTVIFDQLALNVHVENRRRIQLLVQLLQPLLLVEVRVLYYPPLSFQPNPSLATFWLLSPCLYKRKRVHRISFFKAFEPILRHVLCFKTTPLYLVICFVTCWHTKLLQNDRTCQQVIKTCSEL